MTETQVEPVRAPARQMLLVGGLVLAISVAAFFRVPILPSVGADLGMTAGQLGLITTVFALGRLVTDIPAGRLADRTPPTWSLGGAGLVLALGSLAFGSARSAAWVIAAAAVLGVASAVSNTTGMTFFSTATPAAQRGMAMAGFSAALLGGQALGPMVGGLLAGAWGWRTAVLSASVVGIAVGAVGLGAVHRAGVLRRRRGGPPPGTTAPVAAAVGSPAKTQRLVLYAVSFSSFFMLGAMPQTLVPIIGADQHGLGASSIGLALGLGGACRLVGSLVGGRLADRVSRKASLVPGLVLCAVGVSVLALDDAGVGGWRTAIVLLSLGSYGISVGATMLADHARGAGGVGRRLGTYRFVGDLGLIAGPVLTALLYEHVGNRAAVLTVAGLLAAVALLSAVVLEETRWLTPA